MTEDDGYETVVHDMGGGGPNIDDKRVADLMFLATNNYYRRCEIAARHRQAAYNQALKDAAEVLWKYAEDHHEQENWVDLAALDLRQAILSLGDKGNG